MPPTNFACFTREIDSSMVLLARIVDGAGRPIRPSQVTEIEYSVFERGPCESEYSAMDAIQPPVRLVASDVLSPTLVNDDSWSVDVAGYNFRHCIAIGAGIATSTKGRRIQLRYVFSCTDNTKQIIQFHLKLV